jgi:hypothetical protein
LSVDLTVTKPDLSGSYSTTIPLTQNTTNRLFQYKTPYGVMFPLGDASLCVIGADVVVEDTSSSGVQFMMTADLT